MEYKEIVIRIPEKDYDRMCRGELVDTVLVAIKNGIPLPKGHGELIDRNDLKYEKYNSYAYAIANAPTIIETDKE